ncbi:MAG: biotin/lipoate--protein ligase family protein [Pseudomonadota bacterium]
MNDPINLPPLFSPQPAGKTHAFEAACTMAQEGCDAGVVTHALRSKRLEAAIVFAPEVPLSAASIVLPICGIGFQNALGTVAPPEVAVHLEWSGGIKLNGGRAGALRFAASPETPEAVPDWMVVGLELNLLSETEHPGHAPDIAALFTEGCGDVDPVLLIEAWVRHTLVWINRWMEEGTGPIHAEWTSRADTSKGTLIPAGRGGEFVGLDENLGLILRSGTETIIVPLSDLLQEHS